MKVQYEAIRSGAIQGGVIRNRGNKKRRASGRNVYVYGGSYGGSHCSSSRRTSNYNGFFAVLLRPVRKKLREVATFLIVPSVRKAIGRTVLLTVVVAILCNFICVVRGGGITNEIAVLEKQRLELESTNIHLHAKRAITWGPDNMAKMAGERLQLYPAEKGQKQVYSRHYATFHSSLILFSDDEK